MKGPHEPTYFTDRSLGKRFPEALAEAGIAVATHDRYFGPQAPDDVWLAAAAQYDWIALTRDARICYSPLALKTIAESKAKLFVLVGKMNGEQCIALFLKWQQRVGQVAHGESRPFIAKVRRDGVNVWRTF